MYKYTVRLCPLMNLPVLSRSRLHFHMIHDVHLRLVWSKDLEAGPISAQMVHGAENTHKLERWLCAWHFTSTPSQLLSVNASSSTTHFCRAERHTISPITPILTKQPRGCQCHPTSHTLRTPGTKAQLNFIYFNHNTSLNFLPGLIKWNSIEYITFTFCH